MTAALYAVQVFTVALAIVVSIRHFRSASRREGSTGAETDLLSTSTEPSREFTRTRAEIRLPEAPSEPKIYLPNQRGEDVRRLQEKLARIGYLPHDDALHPYQVGEFDEATRRGLIEFQQDFGIYADGVAGEVTHIVLDFLQGYELVNGRVSVPPRERHLIDRVTRREQKGLAFIGACFGEEVAPLNWADIVTGMTVRQLNRQGIQAGHLPETGDFADFTNDRKADCVVLVQSLGVGDIGPLAVRYFGVRGAPSPLGQILAVSIFDELAVDLPFKSTSLEAEDSEMLMRPDAPCVRIEISFSSQNDLSRVADAIARGVAHFNDSAREQLNRYAMMRDVPKKQEALRRGEDNRRKS